MATWVNPVDSQTDPDAPITSDLAKRWDNNVVALAEGAAGAPRVADAALSATVTAAGRNWVANRIISASWDAVGQYVMAFHGTPRAPGYVASGSSLQPHNAGGELPAAGTLPGSWRLQGRTQAGSGYSGPTSLWLRVS